MANQHTAHWYPTAAYLYVLHLDGPALAWEYLRRNGDYRLDWRRRRHRPQAAPRWGLRLLEDPALDARDAHPVWFPDHDSVVQLCRDADPPPDAMSFEFWRIPGRKQLIHDGKRLVLAVQWPGCCLRFALAPELQEGMAFAHVIRACATPCARYQALVSELGKLTTAHETVPVAAARPRPTFSALQELHTLQALDATLAGASLREVAEGLFGGDAVALGWSPDGGLRAKVRRLVRRGRALMRGGYRALANLSEGKRTSEGRSKSPAQRP